MACRGTQGTDVAKLELKHSAAPSSYKNRSGVMSDGNEAIANLQENGEVITLRRAVYVFAGGTAATMRQFASRTERGRGSPRQT
jgi:hypothetical protein